MPDILRLLWGTVELRPYVFAFLAAYAVTAAFHMGRRRMLAYIPLGYSLAWLSEFSSIHVGFPYGDYYYIPSTMDRELWVFGVPFMDSLSYVFLSYCSYSMAVFMLSPAVFRGMRLYVLETRSIRRSIETLVLGAFLFVLLDIIIDPVALQGYRWFLGQIYGYREVGLYFGVPMSNFGGWLIVGFVLVGTLQVLDRARSLESEPGPWCGGFQGPGALGPVLYASVLVFNLWVTFMIGEHLMGLAGILILFFFLLPTVFFFIHKQRYLTREAVERHITDFPHSKARALLAPSGVTARQSSPETTKEPETAQEAR